MSSASTGVPLTRRALAEARRRTDDPAEPPRGREGDRAGSEPPAPRRRARRWIGLGVLVLVVLVLIAAVWVGVRALTVKDDLEAARAEIGNVGEDAAGAIERIGSHADSAAAAANDPVWRAFEFIPWAGDNLRGVRLAAESLDVVANDLGRPALAALEAQSEEPLFGRLLPVFAETTPEVVRLADELADVRASGALIGPVRDGVVQVGDVMAAAAPALELAPELLGGNGPRSYLLVFQNNAESVGLGGSAASQTLVNVDGGDIQLAEQASSSSYREGTQVDVEVDQSALDLFGPYLTSHINTSPSRPDFPTMARIAAAFWQRDVKPEPVDGVISIDPIALSRVLKATGPIDLPTGDTIDQGNAVQLLLNEVYFRWDSRYQGDIVDAFFAGVAVSVFEKVTSGDFNIKDMAWAVNEGIRHGNIMFWSQNPAVQKEIAATPASGILPKDNEDSTTVGVFFRDESASKIDYYMRSGVDVTETCEAGQRTFTTSARLHLDIDQAAADQLPAYVMSGHWGSSMFRTQVYVYGPPGTTVQDVAVDGREVRVMRDDAQDLDRPVAWFETYLAPGERANVTATFAGEDGEYGDLAVRTTPMVNTTKVDTSSSGCG